MDKIHNIKDIPPIHNQEEIKEKILEYLYSRFKRAAFPGEHGANFEVIEEALKRLGLKRDEITSNFMSLKSNGWIDEKVKKYKIMDMASTEHYYYISARGINHFEGPSKFQETRKYDGINITNIQGVIAIGDGNIVQNQYIDLYHNLVSLGNEVRQSNDFSDEIKLNIQADIDTIKSQILKKLPDKGIIQKAWEAIKVVATVGSVVNLVITINNLISHYFN